MVSSMNLKRLISELYQEAVWLRKPGNRSAHNTFVTSRINKEGTRMHVIVLLLDHPEPSVLSQQLLDYLRRLGEVTHNKKAGDILLDSDNELSVPGWKIVACIDLPPLEAKPQDLASE